MQHSPWYIRWLVGLTVIVALFLLFMPNRSVAQGAATVAKTAGIALGIVVFSAPTFATSVATGKEYMEVKAGADRN